MACSYHKRNLIPKYFSSVVCVLDFPPLSGSEQLGGLSATNPKLVLVPKRMEIPWVACQSGMTNFIFNWGGSGIVIIVVVGPTMCWLHCNTSNGIVE